MRCGYVDTRWGQVHHRSCGEGWPLVLLHQPPRSSRVYGRLMEELEAVGDVRVLALDLPGFGQSCDLPPGATIEGIAANVAQAMQALDCETASVFGLHTGNKIAAALAAQHPAAVERLALAGMTHSIILDASRRNAAMSDYLRRKVPTDPERHPAAWHDEQIDQFLCRGRDAIYAANYAFDLAAALRRVSAPALVIELAVPEEEHLGRAAQALCGLMTRARALRIDCDDRTLLQERPRDLAVALHDFIFEQAEQT